jgi:ATP-dependent RNA helicase RhlE
MPFQKLRLIEPLQRAIRDQGYDAPTAIQEQAIPHVVAGRDLLGCAQTGTGKTAAFALPILQRLHPHANGGPNSPKRRPIRALILTPTRELAAQIGESFQAYGQHAGLRHTVIYGGVKQGAQCQALRRGVDILIATPGRLLDLGNQGELDLSHVEVFVLDEADRMLDMGFIHDIRRVIAQVPAKRQTLLFSATMPGEIRKLADTILNDPITITVAAQSAAAETVQQAVCHVERRRKIDLLQKLLREPGFERTLVFSRTKRGADRITKKLVHAGIAAEAIHSDKSQTARMRALANFKRGTARVLVASDIASRGLDVEQVSHVINYDMPGDAETYVHRIGRTGRAGAEGQAITFCTEDDHDVLAEIERMLKNPVPVLHHKLASRPPIAAPKPHAVLPVAKSNGNAKQNRPSGTPEQQKNTFWRKRRKRRAGSGGSRKRNTSAR